MRAVAINFMFVAVFAGCVARDASPFDRLTPTQSRALAADLASKRERALHDDLATAFTVHPPANVLVLSGGDAHGAFGCGVLAGWRTAVLGPRRPVFDVVTGVSTGALMATFAFLGEERDDALLRDVYLSTRDAQVFRGPIGGPPDALFDTAPLQNLIARHVTADTLRRVAAAHAAGRRLYVATVDLDTGALVTWPMSRLAAEAVGLDGTVDSARLDRFRAILLAAASIPVLFPPVEIDGGLHVDAGLRQAVFLDDAMLGSGASPTVWLIFNGRLGAMPQAIDANVADIGGRSAALFAGAVEMLSVRQVAGVATGHRPSCGFHWVSQPPGDAAAPLVPALFDPARTRDWYAQGESAGRAGLWHDGPPTEAEPAGTAGARDLR